MKEICKNLKWFYERSEREIDEIKNNIDIDDLTNHQLYYLYVIYHMNGSNLSAIAARLKLKKPTVTILINRLINKGYVTKVVNKRDKRSFFVEVTQKTVKILSMRDEAFNRIINELSLVLTSTELIILSELLKKFKSVISPENSKEKISEVVELRPTA